MGGQIVIWGLMERKVSIEFLFNTSQILSQYIDIHC